MIEVVPIFQDEAFAFIAKYHRHHGVPQGSIFQIAVSDGNEIVGVAVVGRPTAQQSQDGFTAEVTRLCTIGHKNACSMLYAACWRAARAMGYRRIITFVLSSESGKSVQAAGWKCLYKTKGGSWDRKGRPRVDKHPTQAKLLFEMK